MKLISLIMNNSQIGILSIVLCINYVCTTPGVNFHSNSIKTQCGSMKINPAVMICCNGLVYVKSGIQPACCGSVGYDKRHYYCCASKTIIRKDRYKVPRCCGERGYDGLYDTCEEGYQDKQTDLGSNCCMTDRGWKCCAKDGNCCSEYGSGQIDIPGFRPACCHIESRREKANCCENTLESMGILPSCCDASALKKHNNKMLTNYENPFGRYPRLTRAPYQTVRPRSSSEYNTRSRPICCTKTRRTCCRGNVQQPCCYSIIKPQCCYTARKSHQSCCERNVRSHFTKDLFNLQTARVNRNYNWESLQASVTPPNNRYYPYITSSYQQINRYNPTQSSSCCNAWSVDACCRDRLAQNGRLVQCCDGNHEERSGPKRAMELNQIRQNIRMKDITPQEEIMTQNLVPLSGQVSQRRRYQPSNKQNRLVSKQNYSMGEKFEITPIPSTAFHDVRVTNSDSELTEALTKMHHSHDALSYDQYRFIKCNGEPYDLAVYICCDGILRYRIGVEPMCCSTEAYDASIYKCCNGIIRRACDS